jgi:hypothetical protein
VYFDDRTREGSTLLASLVFFRAIEHQLGLAAHAEIDECFVGAEGAVLFPVDVNWDLPVAFVLYLRQTNDNSCSAALMVNLNKGLAGRSENSVVARDVGRAIAPLRAAG